MIESWMAIGFLALLAAAGIPIMVALPFMLYMRMRLMDDIMRQRQFPRPPPRGPELLVKDAKPARIPR